MNISIVSGQIAKVHVKLETEERFELYGGTDRASFDIAEERLNEFVVTVREETVAGKPLSRYNVYVRQPSSGREWVVLSGKLLVSPRTADISADKLAPVEYKVTIPVVDNLVDLTGMAIVTGIIGPRGWSAYEIAVQEGFEGTESEWLEHMRQLTATLAVEQVTPLMERAETAAGEAENQAENAEKHMKTAAAHAKAAKESELSADEHNAAAADEVTKAAAEVQKAAAEVEKAKQERETAATHATAAAQSAQDAMANQQAAEQAAQDAARAQVAAETAKAEANAAKIVAQTSEQNAKASADAAAADKASAEQAKIDALAAQSKAEVEAAKAEQNAALLGDAALQSGDNNFSGNNDHGGTEIFNGAVALNGTVDATAAAMQLPVELLREMSGWPGLMGPACTEVAMLGPMFGSTLENEVLVLNCPNLSNVSFSSTGLINSTLKGSGGQYDGRTLNKIGSATARVVVSIAPTVLTSETWERWGKLEEVYILVTQGNYGRNQLPRAVLQQSGNFPKLRKLVVIAPFANVLPLYFTDGLTSVLDELIFIMPKMPTLEGYSSGTWTSMLGKIRGCSRARVYLPALQGSLTIGNTQMDSASVVFLLNGLPTVEEPPLTVTLGVGAGVLAGTDETGVQTYADETLTAAVAAAAEKGWSVVLIDNSNAY